MKLEVTSAMPIGYQKGNTYHLHTAGDVYMELPIFKLLTGYAMKRQFGTHVSWTHITREYDVEMQEIIYFKNSGLPYMFSRANRGGSNPLAALCAVLPVVLPMTPLLAAMILEAECVLLGMALDKARDIEARIDRVADDLRKVLDSIIIGFRQGDVTIGEPMPLGSLRSKPMPQGVMARLVALEDNEEYIAACAQRARDSVVGIPAAPGEDDDL